MRFTVWQKKPTHKELHVEPYRPLAREVKEYEVQLVHWTGDGSTPGTECRVVTIAVDADGGVSVEHSTSETTGSGIDPEHATRVYLPGWED